ncbi:hypothetical protein IAG44_19760 [Streptomyces roseirectus]|uniref:Uncharacterized protein n=1 Tax=Streptomyces roseirectus TaxID=2768066 RepID=A0A7H0IF85_9ACTN|nr:hypothetical protein [Streptomyces roseirectus]QNP71451.1 hypothetical protein IAG44_19760 [Streptomyces roseirectus]
MAPARDVGSAPTSPRTPPREPADAARTSADAPAPAPVRRRTFVRPGALVLCTVVWLCGTGEAGALEPSPAPRSTPERAGSHPGEGRERPGRVGETAVEEGPVPQPSAEPSGAAPSAEHPGGTPDAASAVRPDPVHDTARRHADGDSALHVLPLGSGLVLVGLGLALALAGLRLRRG